MNIYWKVILITIILAAIFKRNKKAFVLSATIVHTFVAGFRYMYMHGDLKSYANGFYMMKDYKWFSDDILHEGRNTLFYVLNKLVSTFANDDFQVLLLIIALISSASIGVLIYRYSPKPLVSYIVWNCFGYYMFSFYSLKQTIAMAFVMFAAIGIFENNLKKFLLFSVIAGFFHLPAFVFLPAFFLARIKNARHIILVYFVIFITVFIFRNTIVSMMSDLYYESERFSGYDPSTIGGKCIMMILILLAGYMLCGMSNEVFRKLFVLISIASLLQIFSMYDNIFTRLADYYFQFFILYAPCMLAQVHKRPYIPPMYFDKRSQQILTIAFIVLALVFYQLTSLDVGSVSNTDNLLNFKFMWEVQ